MPKADDGAADSSAARQHLIGWTFVAAQAVLLITLIVLPGRDDWPTPGGVEAVALAATSIGVIVLLVAALRLGRGLTPTPVPKDDGELVVTGLYRFVRHPIYTGVLALVIGIVLRSGSLVTLAVGVVTFLFFNAKAAWEEKRLAERYDDYPAYAARTHRFLPRL